MSTYKASPSVNLCSQNCESIYEFREHVLLGISPFNSYYSEENITALVRWASETFKHFHIFIPDTLPEYNFIALGYAEEKAKKKSLKQARYLKNKIIRAFKSLGFSNDYANHLIIDMEKLQQNEFYQKHRDVCFNLFENDLDFRKDCLEATEWTLNSYQVTLKRSPEKQIAVHYLLEEMLLFLDTPSILNVNSSLFCYHQTPLFIKKLYTSYRKSTILSLQQGFIEIQFENQCMIQGANIDNGLRQ